MKHVLFMLILLTIALSCNHSNQVQDNKNFSDSAMNTDTPQAKMEAEPSDEIIINQEGQIVINVDTSTFDSHWVSDRFVYPVNHGKSLSGYTEAFGFHQKNKAGSIHLGTDISKPGELDFGDTLYSISNGRVLFVLADILMVLHKTNKQYLVSVYRHCNEIFVTPGQYIHAAQAVGTIGNSGGAYPAHLHLELREDISLGIESGYYDHDKIEGYLDPVKFIKAHNK